MSDLRRKDFKAGFNTDDTRRKREEVALRLRKSSRDALKAKKRNFADSPSAAHDPAMATKLQAIPRLVQMLRSNDQQQQYEATMQFRRILSIEKNPPIGEVILAGVVPDFVRLLEADSYPQLQFEAAWALTNIASGTPEQTRVVISHNAVPIFVRLLGTQHDDVREQAVWALGNIAGDSPRCRDYVLEQNAMAPLLANLVESEKLSMLRNATWALSNFCRGKPAPRFALVSPALNVLNRLIYYVDEEVLTDTCWALSYLSDGTNDQIQAVIDVGVSRRLVELLMHNSYVVKTPALRTVGNIVTGDDLQTQVVINVGVLAALHGLLSSAKKSIKKEACWAISNITAGSQQQVQAVIEANIIPRLIELLQTAEFDIRKEAAWAVSNATTQQNPKVIDYLVREGCIEPLVSLLDVQDTRIIVVALEALDNILRVGQELARASHQENLYAMNVEQCGGLDKLEELQTRETPELYDKSRKIIAMYFPQDEVDMNPGGVQAGGQFSFGGGGEQQQFNL